MKPIPFTLSVLSMVLYTCILGEDYGFAPGGTQLRIPTGNIQTSLSIYDLGGESEQLKPALIHIHGWMPEGHRAGALGSYYARYFSLQHDYVGVAVTMRGWPDTGGKDDCGLEQPNDISTLVNWLAEQPGIDPSRIGIVGHSQGGQVGLLAASINSKVKVVVAFYPLTDVTRWNAQNTDLSSQMIDSYVNGTCAHPGTKKDRSPLFAAESIEASVLLLHGDADTRVAFDQSARFHRALEQLGKESKLIRIEKGSHNSGAREWDELAVLQKVGEWLKVHL